MYKVLVLKNRVKVEVKDDFDKAKDYIKRHHNFEVDFEFKDIDIPVETSLWKESGGRLWFGTKNTKDKIKQYLPENKYHCVMFTWDKTESPISNLDQSKYALTSWSTWREAIPGTEYIELVTAPYDDKVNHIYHSIIHEMYHSFVKRANRRGANIVDVMDRMIVNGKEVTYYKNSEPEAPDGNFAAQREILEPHTDKILYTPPQTGFEHAVEIILENEGGYVNDKRDPGGETNMGISKRAYPDLDIKNLTKDQAKQIYFKDYWKPIKADFMPSGIALQVFDMAVNAGVSQAAKLLQRIVGVKDDGVIGRITLGAVENYKGDINMEYLLARVNYYSALDNVKIYGAGWVKRAVKVYQLTQ
jgi:hypothetical protein